MVDFVVPSVAVDVQQRQQFEMLKREYNEERRKSKMLGKQDNSGKKDTLSRRCLAPHGEGLSDNIRILMAAKSLPKAIRVVNLTASECTRKHESGVTYQEKAMQVSASIMAKQRRQTLEPSRMCSLNISHPAEIILDTSKHRSSRKGKSPKGKQQKRQESFPGGRSTSTMSKGSTFTPETLLERKPEPPPKRTAEPAEFFQIRTAKEAEAQMKMHLKHLIEGSNTRIKLCRNGEPFLSTSPREPCDTTLVKTPRPPSGSPRGHRRGSRGELVEGTSAASSDEAQGCGEKEDVFQLTALASTKGNVAKHRPPNITIAQATPFDVLRSPQTKPNDPPCPPSFVLAKEGDLYWKRKGVIHEKPPPAPRNYGEEHDDFRMEMHKHQYEFFVNSTSNLSKYNAQRLQVQSNKQAELQSSLHRTWKHAVTSMMSKVTAELSLRHQSNRREQYQQYYDTFEEKVRAHFNGILSRGAERILAALRNIFYNSDVVTDRAAFEEILDEMAGPHLLVVDIVTVLNSIKNVFQVSDHDFADQLQLRMRGVLDKWEVILQKKLLLTESYPSDSVHAVLQLPVTALGPDTISWVVSLSASGHASIPVPGCLQWLQSLLHQPGGTAKLASALPTLDPLSIPKDILRWVVGPQCATLRQLLLDSKHLTSEQRRKHHTWLAQCDAHARSTLPHKALDVIPPKTTKSDESPRDTRPMSPLSPFSRELTTFLIT